MGLAFFNTAKRYSRVFVFAMTILGFFSFKAVETMVGSKKAATTLCFEFDSTILAPDAGDVIVPGNYSYKAVPACFSGNKLCGICFNDADFPLNEDELPDFGNNPDLEAYVIANMTNGGLHGIPTVIPGIPSRTVTLYFRN